MFRRTDGKIESLRRVESLSTLSDTDLKTLAALADVQQVPPRAVLVEQDRRGYDVFLILEGEVRVSRDGQEVARLGAGQFVGEMALLDHQPRSATVVTTTATRVLVFAPRAFDEMVTTSRAMTARLLEQVTTRLRHAGS